MSVFSMVAGAPFFLGDGEGDGASLVSGFVVAPNEGVGESPGVGVGDEERLCFFFEEGLGEDSGSGVGEDFCFFFPDEAPGSDFSVGKGLPEALFFFCEEGEGDFSGVADGFGEGDFSASSFVFSAFELLRCLRGAGVGVGAKIFFIFLPNDSSACAWSTTPESIVAKKKAPAILVTRRMVRESSTRAGEEYAGQRYYSGAPVKRLVCATITQGLASQKRHYIRPCATSWQAPV